MSDFFCVNNDVALNLTSILCNDSDSPYRMLATALILSINLRQGWEGVLSEVIGSFILVSLAAIFVSFCKAPPHCVTKQKQRLQVRAGSSNVFGGGGDAWFPFLLHFV